MKAEELLDLIGEVDDRLLEDAEPVEGVIAHAVSEDDAAPIEGIISKTASEDSMIAEKVTTKNDKSVKKRDSFQKENKGLIKWISLAACLCIAAVGIFLMVKFVIVPKGNDINNEIKSGGTPYPEDQPYPNGGEGSSGGSGYMSYEGPVLPLTSVENDAELTATRIINFDFSDYESYAYKADITDSYVLTNAAEKERTVSLLYPFTASLETSSDVIPVISVAGNPVMTKMSSGPSGESFELLKKGEKSGNIDVLGLKSWEAYENAIGDDYLVYATKSYPDLNQMVFVYEFNDFYGEEEEICVAPTVNIAFDIDFSRSAILSYGFEGMTNDIENGHCERSFFVPQPDSYNYKDSKYLIVLGEDIDGYTIQAYTNGGCETATDNAGAAVTSYATTLEEIIRLLTERALSDRVRGDMAYGETILSKITMDDLYGMMAERLQACGYLTEKPDGWQAHWYSDGSLEALFADVVVQKRIFYLAFDVTLPANMSGSIPSKNSILVSIEFAKRASVNYAGQDINKNGYDMAVNLGSGLNITEQTATVSNTDYIEIVGQNFDFDVENGLDRVILNEKEGHYCLDVIKK